MAAQILGRRSTVLKRHIYREPGTFPAWQLDGCPARWQRHLLETVA